MLSFDPAHYRHHQATATLFSELYNNYVWTVRKRRCAHNLIDELYFQFGVWSHWWEFE